MKRCIAVMLAAIAMGLSSTAQAGELELRQAVFNETRGLLERHDFDGLDRMRAGLADLYERSPSGVPKLSFFYCALECFYAGELGESEVDALERRAVEWHAHAPQSPAAAIHLAAVHMIRAWRVRGTGLASAVSPEQFAEAHRYAGLRARHCSPRARRREGILIGMPR